MNVQTMHLLVLLVLVFTACKDERVREPAKEPVVTVRRALPVSRPDVAPAPAPAGQSEMPDAAPAPDRSPPPPARPSTEELSWSFEPERLDVMRDTRATLKVDWPGVDPEEYVCEWDPGDRTGIKEGCRVEHNYKGGMSDRTVSVLVTWKGEQVLSESRPLPLERLPVQELSSASQALPEPPAPSEGNRTVFASLFLPLEGNALEQLAGAITVLRPSLALVFINFPIASPEAVALLERLNDGPAMTAIPVYCDRTKLDSSVPVVRSPHLLAHGEDNAPPYRHAFLHSGTLYALLDAGQDEYNPGQEKWLLDTLKTGKVAPHRVVVSCAPLESYTGKSPSELEPKFRWYEKVLRGDVSLLVSSLDPVFFHGRYGDQATLSAGCISGSPGRLPGTEQDQNRTLTVVDFVQGKSPFVYPVSPDQPDKVLDQSAIPFRVGNYYK